MMYLRFYAFIFLFFSFLFSSFLSFSFLFFFIFTLLYSFPQLNIYKKLKKEEEEAEKEEEEEEEEEKQLNPNTKTLSHPIHPFLPALSSPYLSLIFRYVTLRYVTGFLSAVALMRVGRG